MREGSTATVLPVDVSLYLTPDMESRVVIYESAGKTITSKDFSSFLPLRTNAVLPTDHAKAPSG